MVCVLFFFRILTYTRSLWSSRARLAVQDHSNRPQFLDEEAEATHDSRCVCARKRGVLAAVEFVTIPFEIRIEMKFQTGSFTNRSRKQWQRSHDST